MADLGGAPGARPRYGPNISQFHATFCKIWQNHMLAAPLEGWRPLLRGILDPPLLVVATDPGGMHPTGMLSRIIPEFFPFYTQPI